MILKTSVDRLLHSGDFIMACGVNFSGWTGFMFVFATHPIARLPNRLASLLLLAGGGPAASSRLARQSGKRTPGRVQLRFPG
jgi:hypothetical protein